MNGGAKRWRWPSFTWPEAVAYALALVAYGGIALQYGLVAGLWVIPAIIAGSIVGHDESHRRSGRESERER